MSPHRQALPAGADPRRLARQVSAAHDKFLLTGRTDDRVRPMVEQSWQRCLRGGLDPEQAMAPVELVDDELDLLRDNHPLSTVMPVIRRLLVDGAAEAGLLVAVSDAAGRLMWVEGQTQARSRAEHMHFVEGAAWDENHAGTNAPGTALTLDQAVQIFAAEHLSRRVTPWSCAAAPIHDPDTGAVLGALDLTGGEEVAGPYALSLVRATVAAVEGELRVQRLLSARPGRPARPMHLPDGLRLETLGREVGLLRSTGSSTRLSLRHSELLTLLAAQPEGIGGEQLSSAMHEHGVVSVTLRAELSRLRALLAPGTLRSRPYRLVEPLSTDSAEVAELLNAGRLGPAVDRYRGPVLPASDAPGVVRLRGRLHEELRSSLLRSGNPDALLRFADTEHGLLDWQVWQAASRALPASSPRRVQVRAHLAQLDRELRSP